MPKPIPPHGNIVFPFLGGDSASHKEKTPQSSSISLSGCSATAANEYTPLDDVTWPYRPSSASFSPTHHHPAPNVIQCMRNNHNQNNNHPSDLTKLAMVRKSFLLFVKILLKCTDYDSLLREQCKLAVYRFRLLHQREKQERSRSTSPSASLSVSLSSRQEQNASEHLNQYRRSLTSLYRQLQQIVGSHVWDQTKQYYELYRYKQIRRRGQSFSSISASSGTTNLSKGRGTGCGSSFPIELKQLLQGEEISITVLQRRLNLPLRTEHAQQHHYETMYHHNGANTLSSDVYPMSAPDLTLPIMSGSSASNIMNHLNHRHRQTHQEQPGAHHQNAVLSASAQPPSRPIATLPIMAFDDTCNYDNGVEEPQWSGNYFPDNSNIK